MLSIFAGSIHTADAAFLAFLLASCAAVFCLRVRAGTLLGALLLAAAQALDRSSLSFFLGVSAICLIQSLLKADESARSLVGRILRILLCTALGMAVYLGGFMLFLHRAGLDREAALQAPAGKTVVGAWLYPLALLFKPLTIYAHVGVVLHALLIALGAFALLRLLPKMKGRVPALALLLLAFPLLVNLPAYSTLSAEQTSMPYVLLDALLIVLLQAAFESSVDERHLAYRAGTVMLGVSLLGTTIFANQVYLKKTLEFDSTLSVMTRVIARAEAVPAFKPAKRPSRSSARLKIPSFPSYTRDLKSSTRWMRRRTTLPRRMIPAISGIPGKCWAIRSAWWMLTPSASLSSATMCRPCPRSPRRTAAR